MSYSNMGKNSDEKKKRMVIGGVIAALVIISIVVIAMSSGGGSSSDDGSPVDVSCKNPMCQVFATKPDFQQYTYQDSQKSYEDEFWADAIFGGPITEPLMRPASEEGGSSTPVPNSLVDDLKADYEAKGDLSGYFVL